MAAENDYKNVKELYEGARDVRINLCIFEGNADVPGEIASVARVLWKHIPEMARREGVPIDEAREGYPINIVSPDKTMVDAITRDMAASRDLVAWMPSASPESRAMFAKGADNSMNAFFDAFAKEKGFVRDDVLSRERDGIPEPLARSLSSSHDVAVSSVSDRSSVPDGARTPARVASEGAARMSPALSALLSGQFAR
jgi:hypothetical protein